MQKHKVTKKEQIAGILTMVLPVVILITAGYLFASGHKWIAITTGFVGWMSYGNAMLRSAEGSMRKHGCRLAMLDGETMTPSQVRDMRRHDMFQLGKFYRVEAVFKWRDTNVIIIQEEGCPIGTFDTVRVFTTRRTVGNHLRFYSDRNPDNKLIWKFDSHNEPTETSALHRVG